ncbi:MAG TPA: hypothetical protein VHZ24_18095 [Pirellulales bacterium]|jgi:hypothetical protein|nr:hypothetical protein [Pirellulales bacterium]
MYAPSGAESEMPIFLRRNTLPLPAAPPSSPGYDEPPGIPLSHDEEPVATESEEEYAFAEEIEEDELIAARERAQHALAEAIHEAILAEKARQNQPLPRWYVRTLVAIGLTVFVGGQTLPPEWFAGACGIVQLAWLFVATVYKLHSRRIEAAWMIVVVLYLVATVEAIIRLKWL